MGLQPQSFEALLELPLLELQQPQPLLLVLDLNLHAFVVVKSKTIQMQRL